MRFSTGAELSNQLKKLSINIVILIFSFCSPLLAQDFDDIEAEMDMNETSALEATVDDARNILKEKQVLLAQVKLDAKEARARSIAKAKSTKSELKVIEDKIVQIDKEISKYESQKMKASKDYEGNVQKTNARKKEMIELENQLQALRDEKSRQTDVVAGKEDETNSSEAKINAMKREIGALQNELKLAKKDELVAKKRLAHRKSTVGEREQVLQKKLLDAREQVSKSKRETRTVETQMRQLRGGLQELEHEVELAQAEADQAKVRAKESRERLGRVKKTAKNQASNLKTKKRSAGVKERRFEMAEDSAEMKATRLEGISQNEVPIEATETKKVNVQLRKKKTRKTLKKACNLRSKASPRSKVVGKKKKGVALWTASHNRRWSKVYLKAKKTAYMAKSCFK